MSEKNPFEVALEKRAGLDTVTNTFRWVHRGEIGDFSIDQFGEWLLVTGYDETIPSTELLKRVQPFVTSWKGGVVRTHRRDPHRRQLFSDLVPFGAPIPETFEVTEHGLHFEISLNEMQHPGLFLDQRDSRHRIAKIAKGKRIANLFAFTCSFSVVAVAAGADVVFSIDLAAGCLERGKRNFELNGLAESGRGKFIKEDVRKWLARQERRKQAAPEEFKMWDLIICDPPVFAAAKKGEAFSVEKEWPQLAQGVRTILADDGIALFANNHRSGDDGAYFSILKKNFREVDLLPAPLDFPNRRGEPPHVRIYWCKA